MDDQTKAYFVDVAERGTLSMGKVLFDRDEFKATRSQPVYLYPWLMSSFVRFGDHQVGRTFHVLIFQNVKPVVAQVV